jgi:hypothetical protein
MTAIKTWFNATHVPQLDADNLPYLYGVAGGQTIKEALDGLVLARYRTGA